MVWKELKFVIDWIVGWNMRDLMFLWGFEVDVFFNEFCICECFILIFIWLFLCWFLFIIDFGVSFLFSSSWLRNWGWFFEIIKLISSILWCLVIILVLICWKRGIFFLISFIVLFFFLGDLGCGKFVNEYGRVKKGYVVRLFIRGWIFDIGSFFVFLKLM